MQDGGGENLKQNMEPERSGATGGLASVRTTMTLDPKGSAKKAGAGTAPP